MVETLSQLAPPAMGAPVILAKGSALIHYPSVYRIGRGARQQPVSYYHRAGIHPLKWSTMCGQTGVLLLYCELLEQEGDGVCPFCHDFTVRLS